MKSIRIILAAVAAVTAGVVTTYHYSEQEVRELAARVQELEQERGRLVEYAKRLSASRRMAQVDVVNQSIDADGNVLTTLRWVQIGPDGSIGSPEIVTVRGDQVYFEALVIKFDHRDVGEATPDRAASLAMFRRVFGNQQTPETGMPLDQTAPPESGDQKARDAHEALWKRFWELAADPRIATDLGVRVAQIEAPAARMAPGQIWEVSLDAAGGLNVKKLAERGRNSSAPTG